MTKRDISQKYKTRLCKRFHEDLHCQYGIRCQFIHNEPHGRMMNKNRKPIRLLSYTQILAESVSATLQGLSNPSSAITYTDPNKIPRLSVFEQVAPASRKKPKKSCKKKRKNNFNPTEIRREVKTIMEAHMSSENNQLFIPSNHLMVCRLQQHPDWVLKDTLNFPPLSDYKSTKHYVQSQSITSPWISLQEQ